MRRVIDELIARDEAVKHSLEAVKRSLQEKDEYHRQQLRAAIGAVERLDRRTDGLQCEILVQLADLRKDLQRESLTLGNLTREVAAVQRDTADRFDTAAQNAASQTDAAERHVAGLGEKVERLASRAADVAGKTDQLSSGLGAIAARTAQLSDESTALAGRMEELEGLLRNSLAKRCPAVSLDSSLPVAEPELVRLAESLTVLRPLVPYPSWRFDADWYNPDLAIQVRQRLWQHFASRGFDASVRVPWHLGTTLYLHLNNDLSRQIYIAGCIDPNEFAFLDRFLAPGMTFIDVGANEGIYAIFAARRVGASGTVWAIEPSSREVERLRRNRDCNHLDFPIFNVGLSDSEGEAPLIVAEDRYAGLNTLGTIAYQGVDQARLETVRLRSLDDVVTENPLPRLDLVKIDIEGAELRMLRGAAATIQRFRPILLFEVLRPALGSQGTTPEELVDFVRSRGYVLHCFDSETGLPEPAKPYQYTENMIAVPEETNLPTSVYTYLPRNQSDAIT